MTTENYHLDRVVELALLNQSIDLSNLDSLEITTVENRRQVWAQRMDNRRAINLGGGGASLSPDLSRAYSSFIVRYSPDIFHSAGLAVIDGPDVWSAYNLIRHGRRKYLQLEVRLTRTLLLGLPNTLTDLTVLFGLSDDAVPQAAELNISAVDGRATIPSFQDKHLLIGRRAGEPELKSLHFSDDDSNTNMLGGWTEYASPVDVGGVDYNVLVSQQLLFQPTDATATVT